MPGQHGDCLRDAVGGWRICLTSGQIGLAVAAAASDRTRVLLCRLSADDESSSVVRHVRLAAARLLWAGYSVHDSLEALRMLLVRRGKRQARPVLVAIDLFVSGQVEVAQWGAATVRHVTASGKNASLATSLMIVERADDRDWLAAAPADVFAGLPQHLEWTTDPCEVRDNLVHSWLSGERSVGAYVPPIVLANRAEPRLAWSVT